MTDKAFLEAVFLLFGRRLAKVPPFPADNQIIRFNFALNQWELSTGGILSAVQSSSNVGSGAGIALPRVGDDLPFKSLVAGVGIVITPSPTEIEIATVTGVVSPVPILHNMNTRNLTAPETRFISFAGMDDGSTIAELNAENVFPVALKLKNMTIRVSAMTNADSFVNIRKNGANGNQVITIPANTTGTFRDLVNTDNFGLVDVGNYQVIANGVGTLTIDSLAIEVVSQ